MVGALLCGFSSVQNSSQEHLAKFLPVPIVRQATDYSCGAASSLAVLLYWGLTDVGESTLYEELKTNSQDGTDPRDMVQALKKYDLTVRLAEHVTIAQLRQSLHLGETVILDIQAWRENKTIPWIDQWESGHYVVMVGMNNDYLFVMDPSVGVGYGMIPLDELNDRWHDYENRTGVIWKNYQLAIFVKGKRPMTQFPDSLTLVE